MTDNNKLDQFADRAQPHKYEECEWIGNLRCQAMGPHCKCGFPIGYEQLHPVELNRSGDGNDNEQTSSTT